MRFRRTVAPAGKSAGRIAVLLLAAVLIMGMVLALTIRWIPGPQTTTRTIRVLWLSDYQIKIDQDTTFFDVFASVLTDSVRQAKLQAPYVRIQALTPRTASAVQVADFVRIVQALDDGGRVSVDWNLN